MPETEALLERFRSAGTQVLGISIDSVHSHANWACSMGGVSFPLLADFHPKGAYAESLGLYLAEAGITDRATVIIDRAGVVQHASSEGPGGRRNIEDLATEAERIEAAQSGSSLAGGESVPAGSVLYVKDSCGPSRNARAAVTNLGLDGTVETVNVSGDAGALERLVAAGGKDQAPCLVMGGEATYEAADICSLLASRVAPLP